MNQLQTPDLHPLIESIEVGACVDGSQRDVLIRFKNGRVVQISPDFNAINVWEPKCFDVVERDYNDPDAVTMMNLEAGGQG